MRWKGLLKITIALRTTAIALLTTTLIGCGSTEPIIEKPQQATIPTKISIAGDIVMGHQGWLVYGQKANSDDLYAIQILSRVAGQTDTTYKPYAYGLFDTSEIPDIDLTENLQYMVELTVVKRGQSVIAKDNMGGFRAPFTLGAKKIQLTNVFTKNSVSAMLGLFKGTADLVDESAMGYKQYKRPMLDRYAGVVYSFSPSSGRSIELSARRVVFGIMPKCVGLTEGRVEIEFEGAQTPLIIHASDQGNEPMTYIFSLAGDPFGSSSWVEDRYEEQVNVSATWVDANEVSTPVSSKTITVRRRGLYAMEVILSSPISGSSITFEPETLIPQGTITM